MAELRIISAPTDLPVHFPSSNEFEAMWQQQQAEEADKRRRFSLGQPLERPMTDTIAELLADTGHIPTDHGLDPSEVCDGCGRLFRYKSRGMAKLQLSKHRRKQHPELVTVG